MKSALSRMPGQLLLVLVLGLLALRGNALAGELPEGFCYADQLVPGAVYEVRYATDHNFVGSPIDGYLAPRVILTCPAAEALALVQEELRAFGLKLKIFDGYRPQRAVDHFVRWAGDLSDRRMKAEFYPGVDKKNLFRDGYIAAKSGHSRGSTVDLTIVDAETGEELDMGTPFDYFGPASWPGNLSMSLGVRVDRALLRQVMVSHGFRPLKEEWWHFTLGDEPFPDTYFNFPVR